MTPQSRSHPAVPASNPRFLQKALLSPADTLVFDLEDGVAYSRKADARENIRSFLEKIESELKNASDGPNAEFCLRINGLDSGFEEHDLELLVCVFCVFIFCSEN